MKELLFDTYDGIREDLTSPDLELSYEFLTKILKLVDELCDNIRNGDNDIGRTREVNQKLNR